jgi:hypothetical protein
MTPFTNPFYTAAEIEEIVTAARLHLYNHGLRCAAQAIRNELVKLDIRPLPSVRTINRILSRRGLTHGRTGLYESDVPSPDHLIPKRP